MKTRNPIPISNILLLAVIASLLVASTGCTGLFNYESEKPFTIIALPDTQVYCEKFPEVFYQQTEWVKENSGRLNCKFVIHEGDIVERARNEAEWQIADKAMSVLDGVVPYCFVVGNHDMPTQLYNKYFPVSRYENNKWYGGHYDNTNDNSYHFFRAAGMDFMIICIRFNPDDSVLEWANKIVSEHPKHRVIVATHSYIDRHEFTDEGKKVWEKFASKHKNIFIVLCGHLSVGRRTDIGDHGNTVYALLADYQGLDYGGQGWLRILTFIPQKNVIQVRTYSTQLKKFFGPGDGKYSTPEMNKFDLAYQMTANEKR